VEAGLLEYKKWKLTRDETVSAGQAPTLRVETVGARAKGVPAGASELPMFSGFEEAEHVAVVAMEQEAGRPRGRRFGALVHGVLAAVPLEAGIDVIAAAAELQARILGADERETAAAARAVERVLAHEVLVPARAALARGVCRRETPIQFLDDDGTVIEGVVDLAYEEAGEWTVIDFKTDADPGTIPAYRNQLGLYVKGLKRALGRPVRALLMQV
jgi:ATP-dependent exoDNAse (exonuclease V) beta subunit